MMRNTQYAALMVACSLFAVLPTMAVGQTAKASKPPVVSTVNAHPETASATRCLNDLEAFNKEIGKDRYWLGGSRYGNGYPANAAGYGWFGYPDGDYPASTQAGLQNARPGYEIRSLMTSANILALHGQQQSCESLLSTSRGIYKEYVAGLRDAKHPILDQLAWQQQQIAAAQSVTGQNVAFNSDQLIGTEVRNLQDESLGRVQDLVTSPQTGRIAYLVIVRGGVLGFDQKYVAVPWADFKVTPNVGILVLNSTISGMDAAPKQNAQAFRVGGNFDRDSAKVDAYWKMSLSKID